MKILESLKKPAVAAIAGAILGIALGLVWAWVIQPVQWTNVPPEQWGSFYQEQYLRMAIDSYRVNTDNGLALQRYQSLGDLGPSVLQTVRNNPGSMDMNAIEAFTGVVQVGGVMPTVEGTGSSGESAPAVTNIAVIGGIIIVVALVGFVVFKFLIPLFRRTSVENPTAAMRARDITSQTEMTDYEAMGEEPPIAQFMTTYVLGDDLFDDSFSIESPAGEFMGECGVGISETIGVGEPKKVQAFEVWLFDKNDIQTVTKVLMSSHAFNDVATVQRLEAKGEPFLVERNKQIVLETAALQLVATISDMEYGRSAMPDGSYFERLTLEIAVWPRG
jgi:hypothetical protein